MRQAGILAAGALYALEHHVERLADDHHNAKLLAGAVRDAAGLSLVGDAVDTNIVIFTVDKQLGTAAEFCQRLAGEGVWMLAIGPQQVRAVTHLDVDRAPAEQAGKILATVAAGRSSGKAKTPQGVRYA